MNSDKKKKEYEPTKNYWQLLKALEDNFSRCSTI